MINKFMMPLIMWLLYFINKTESYTCRGSDAFYRCNGYWDGNENTNICFENYDDRQFSTCYSPASGTYYGGWSTNYDPSTWSGYGALTFYIRCHGWCATCDNSNQPIDNCQSCNNGYYKWRDYQRCDQYCPNQVTQPTWWGDNRGQFMSSGNNCDRCDSDCSWCEDSAGNCFTCVTNYYLVDDYSRCITLFSDSGLGIEHSGQCKSRQCWGTSCPTYYYFNVHQDNSSNYAWTGWVSQSVPRTSYGSNVYRRSTNICVFCNQHCDTCNEQSQYDCLKCSRYNYMWRQRDKFCQTYCTQGTFNTGWIGQYIQASTSNVVGNPEYRYCQLCHANCVLCKNSNTQCYYCKDNSTLMDLHSACVSRYTSDPTCDRCRQTAVDMCTLYSTDKVCKSGLCPSYLYFRLIRHAKATTAERNLELSVQNSRYNTITYGASVVDNLGSNKYYRRETSFCMLCDSRCIKCTGPQNTNCTQCRNFAYKWVGYSVCDTQCPPGQYIGYDLSTTTKIETECNTCMSRCQICEIKVDNCTICVGRNYDHLNTNVGFLYVYNSSFSTCLQWCQGSSTPGTVIGYYGSIKTMVCYPCPHPCSNCNINITRNNYPVISCVDNFCSEGLICTTCLNGYALVGGQCIEDNNCREYSYYIGSATTQWSADNCKCLSGYSSTQFAQCNIRCYIRCKTCSGTGSGQCLTCEDGYSLSGSTCNSDNYGSNNWVKGGTNQGSNSANGGAATCGSYYTHFGYQDTTASKYFQHTISISSLSYYAISVKMSLLFVDQFHPQASITINRGSLSTSPVWNWNYNTKSAYGEQQCGTNKMDYLLYVTAILPTWNQSTANIFIKSNEDLIQSQTGTQLHWGIKEILVTALKCHSTCSRCTGSTADDCLSCSTTGYIPVSGKCGCNIDSGYFQWADGVCRYGCQTNQGYFKDSISRKCVKPPGTSNCTAPYRFGYLAAGSSYGQCVIDCPLTTYFATVNLMQCILDCSTQNQYKYTAGGSRTCQDVCPNGYIADPSTGSCVQKCPTGWYLKLEDQTTNPMCANVCPTGYAYDSLQKCVLICPSGYFKQIISLAPKCVSVCTNSQYGNPTTGQCIASCPFPKYGDSNGWLCVDTCSNSNHFMQVKVSNLLRTCVSGCQSGQYGNPFTRKCSNYTLDCPDGYYADTHTNLCETNCTTSTEVAQNSTKKCQTNCATGFAYRSARTCVDVCPSNPSMFGSAYTPTNKQCVTNCNFATTNLYGDSQANRTCVSVCSATPVATFGENSTSLCVDKCSVTNEFGDPLYSKRPCVSSCTTGTFSYVVTKRCVSSCPDSYYSDSTTTLGVGKCVQSCTSPYFADPVSNQCRSYCRLNYYGLSIGIRLCVTQCPYDWFGINMTYTSRSCVQVCDNGNWGDLETSMCYNVKTMCSNNTYADSQKRLCVIATNCTEGTFADPFTKGCQATCSNNYYADDNINTCVPMCSNTPDQYGQWGICRSACISDRFADWQANRTCVRVCTIQPLVLYGIVSTHRCVLALNCPTDHYGDNLTRTCVDPCYGNTPYGDTITRQCVLDCPDGYYGDIANHLCVEICDFSTYHYADNQTGNCQTLCKLGTFGVNASTTDLVPSCEYQCPPNSYARDSDRICVADCEAGLFGDPITRVCHSDPQDCSEGYYANDVSHLCVLPQDCQIVTTHYFAQNSTKTCVQKCDSPNYGDSTLWLCIAVCNTTHFGQNTTRLCISDCAPYSSFAEDQNHLCVSRCSNTPIKHYAQTTTYTCVEAINCPTSPVVTYAQNSSQSCIQHCTTNQWADLTTKRCVVTCPNAYYKDDSTGNNLCSSSCPGTYRFRDNSTGSCVDICPINNSTFGDSVGDRCVYTCPNITVPYFAQVDSNRRCVTVCKSATWGNKINRVCITNPVNQCPQNTWADNSDQLCTDKCSSASGYYGNNITKLCETACPIPSFAYDPSRVCIDICPSSLTNAGLFGDPSTTPTRKCFQFCQTAGLYRDAAASRTCATSCTYNSTYKTYKDSTTMSCQKQCSDYPTVSYADDTLKSCQISCAGSLKKDDATRSCVTTCSSLYDPTTDKCVEVCPSYSSSGVLYANMITNICVVASSCPSNTYADSDNNICTGSCPPNTFKYGDHCVYICPYDYFIDNSLQTCVIAMDCPANYYADNQTRSCVSECSGAFADTTIKRCINRCYGTKYGDPFTRKCENSCSNGLQIVTTNNSCVSNCQIGLFKNPVNSSCSSTCPSPYFADSNTKTCVQQCSANPMTFSTTISGIRKCVSACGSTQMHDMINRKCVTICPTSTYSYSVNMSCVSFCPNPSHYQLASSCVTNCSSSNKYSDDTTRKCVSSCPSGYYKDPLTFKCVVQCQTSPSQYYISQAQGKCTATCPAGTYANNQNMKCVTQCPLSPRKFAENVNHKCVDTCPLSTNTFADLNSGKCVVSCPSTYFADSLYRTCKQNCSYLFSDSTKNPPACVQLCSSGYFADQLTFKCVGTCPLNYFSHTPTRKCVQFCPHGYFADFSSRKCVVQILCPTAYPYADSLTHLCTGSCSNDQWGYLVSGSSSGGKCLYFCPSGYFSNPLTGKCVKQCPSGYFSQITNNTCTQTCPDDKFMDSVNNQCVSLCPEDDGLFADLYNHTCVLSCDPATFTFADSLTRVCETLCTGDQYADEASQQCVSQSSCLNNKFTDPHYKKCVDICYNGTFSYQGDCIIQCPTATDDVYADIQTVSCVAAFSCPDGTYGDSILKRCVEFCSIQSGTFANIGTKKCVQNCLLPLFADNTTRSCVEVCPEVPIMFGDNDTRSCVHECSTNSFADQTINLCVDDCPDGYFADESTLSCVRKCPEGKFGNNITNKCVNTCPSSPAYFGEPRSRQCVLNCPEGTYADVHNNRQCHLKCIGNVNTYAQNSTKKCLTNCLTGFKNIITKQCIEVCSAGYFGHQKICYTDCPSVTPTVFADSESHLCLEDCPDGTYGDLSIRKCVSTCPISENTFADDNTGLCTGQCLADQYADWSTRKCVEKCSTVPSLFGKLPERICVSQCSFGFYANNASRRCQSNCPSGTYADNTTMKCQYICPTDPLMFGENITNKCVLKCSQDRNMYADNSTRTCVYKCSQSDFTFANPISRRCVDTCPTGYFARNDTRTCQQHCPSNTFADELLRICVSKCSVNPVFYGNRDTWTCLSSCPSSSFGNPLNQQCQKNLNGISTCPSDHYADPTTQLCVPVCPMKQDLYGDPITKYCESQCSYGYTADNSTMKCVQKCPQYPNYFEDQNLHRCVTYCPSGTFADPIERKCVETCPDNSYSENKTQRCVTHCQYEPLGYADDTKWICVKMCPEGYFGDNSTLKCVDECPQTEDTYGEQIKNICVKVCPPGFYADLDSRKCLSECVGNKFGDNSSNTCVETCPRFPNYYSLITTHTCVIQCPPTYFAYQQDRTCGQECPDDELYRQNSSQTCVSSCDFSELTFADNLTGYCVERCSQGTFSDPTTHKCVAICPDQPLMYANQPTQSCVQKCPGNTYGQNITRSCVDACPVGSLSFPQNNLCVRYCPVGYFAYQQTAFCVDICPSPYFGDPSTRTCVEGCPLSQLLYADSATRQCVKRCSAGTYSDKQSISCVGICPDRSGVGVQTYAADYNNVCVEECTLPYFGYPLSKKCVNNCPSPYYNNVRDHMCYLCPSVCLSCSTASYCTTCISNYYLQMGVCVTSCSTGYYANDNTMKCVSSLLCKPNFGINSTKQCSALCPTGSYKNTKAYRCDACQPTCLTCISWTNCTSCITMSMAANNYCYPHCNDTNIYYSTNNQTCLTSCLNGTYLYVLYCKSCASTCTNCQGTSVNCTLCAGGLYLQNKTCVQTCSSQYRPNSDRQCIYCGSTCNKALDFSTNITNINGQSNVYITFTDDVNFSDDLDKIFSLQQISRRLLERRLLATYRIQIVDSRTVRIVLVDGGDASNYQLQILQPESISDSNGNQPIRTRDQVAFNVEDTYDTSVQESSNRFSSYFYFLAIISVVSFLFDFQFMKYMQLIFIHYFIVMILPPELSKGLISLRFSTLNYLPTMYSVPEAVLKETVPGKLYDVIGDFSFLRNAGFALTPLALILFSTILMKILSIPQINRFKAFRVWCKQQFDEKFKLAVFIQWMSIIFLNTVFFGFMQMRDYGFDDDDFYLASIIMAHIVLVGLLLLVIFITYRVISFFLGYKKLSQNLKKATDIILKEQEYHQLNSSNIFLFQMKKIDLRNIFYPKINNDNIFPFRVNYIFNFLALMCLPVTYLRGIIISIIIVFGTNTMLQMALCIPLNILCLLYFSRARPYSFKFKKRRYRNYIAIFNQATLIIFQFLLLILGILQRDGASSQVKQSLSIVILIYLTIVLSVNFIYFLFRVAVQFWRKIFLPFSETQLFKNNFPLMYYKLHGDKKKKLLKGIDPRAKQALRAMVKSYKVKKSALRPNQDDKANPQLPFKYKLTYFDRDTSSIGSRSSMTKSQRRNMLKEIFKKDSGAHEMPQKDLKQFQQLRSNSDSVDTQFEEYEEQIEIKAKDLQKYVNNAEQLLKLKRYREDDEDL